MIIRYSGFNIYAESRSIFRPPSGFIFFLHGFTGGSEDWNEIIPHIDSRFACAVIDLVGHGKSDSPEETAYYMADSVAKQILSSVNAFTNDKIVLIGYSMGGRAALNFAVNYPGRLNGLVLESATAGIKNPEERKERIEKDAWLAQFISAHTIEEFVDYWMNQDLFATQLRFSKSRREEIRKRKLKNSKTGLINCLNGFGTGVMLPLHDRLSQIACETLLITGGLDPKFTQINSGILEDLPAAKHLIIDTAGHNTHLEEPSKFIKAVNEFLERL